MTRVDHRSRFGGSKRRTAGRAQPRPAFGLRPWFALLRRARSLRRFAFAIVGGSVPGHRAYRPRRLVTVTAGTWRSPPIVVPTSFAGRLVGIRANPGGGLLLRTRSVYTTGRVGPLRILHLDRDGRVVHHDILMPGRRVASRSAWILELPMVDRGPDTGASLIVLPSPDE